MLQRNEKKIEELNIEAMKYGLNVRLVNENDAKKILQLRTNETLSRHILKTDANIDKRKQYINIKHTDIILPKLNHQSSIINHQ